MDSWNATGRQLRGTALCCDCARVTFCARGSHVTEANNMSDNILDDGQYSDDGRAAAGGGSGGGQTKSNVALIPKRNM